jgi:hypothetical protein
MLPGAEVVNESLPVRVCPVVVGVSICTVLVGAGAASARPLANKVMARARRWGDEGMADDLVMETSRPV